MKKLKMPVEFNGGDVDFLACSIAYMEASGRNMNIEHVAGNMNELQKKDFYERLENYRTALLDMSD